MENKNIIIILVAIIVILAAAIGFILFNPIAAKEPCKIFITSDEEQYEGGELSIVLADLNKNPISKQKVNITITNSKDKIVFKDVVKLNSRGQAKVDLDLKKGEYVVNVTYDGNKHYAGNNTTQKLTIKEEIVEPVAQQSTQSSTSSNEIFYDEEINLYYDSNGKIVDPDGQHPQGVGESYSKYRDARDRWERGEPVMV